MHSENCAEGNGTNSEQGIRMQRSEHKQWIRCVHVFRLRFKLSSFSFRAIFVLHRRLNYISEGEGIRIYFAKFDQEWTFWS